MYRLIGLLGLGLLAGCGWGGGSDPVALPVGHRNPQVMIASQALFDPARFAGTWYVVADQPPPGRGRCAITRETWVAGPQGFTVTGSACGPRGPALLDNQARMIGPGRIAPMGEGRPDIGTEPIWVLWMDADARVAALGTPSGRFAAIVSRQPSARGDLVTAARTVLDFNGYDLRAIRAR